MLRTIDAPNHYVLVKLCPKRNAEKHTVRHLREVVMIVSVYTSSTEIVRKMKI